MHGPPMRIHINKDDSSYRPLKMKVARRTPKHYKKEADKLIKKLADSGVIVKVPATENVENGVLPGSSCRNPTGRFVWLLIIGKSTSTLIGLFIHSRRVATSLEAFAPTLSGFSNLMRFRVISKSP